MSVGQLVNFFFIMKHDSLKLFDPSQRLVLSSPLSENKTFQANIKTIEGQCLPGTMINQESWQWHLRFGHLNFRILNQLEAKEMVIGLPKIIVPEKVCEVRFVGNHPRNTFKSHMLMRTLYVLNVVNYNVCGRFEVPSLGGNKYFTSFVDK